MTLLPDPCKGKEQRSLSSIDTFPYPDSYSTGDMQVPSTKESRLSDLCKGAYAGHLSDLQDAKELLGALAPHTNAS